MIDESHAKYLFSLNEASTYLMKRGRNISVEKLINAGIIGHLKICAFFSCKGFSPTIFQKLSREQKLHRYTIEEISNRGLSGFYEIPQCYLLEIESDNFTFTDYVISDEGDEFNPEQSSKKIKLEDLKVKLEHLTAYLSKLGGVVDASIDNEEKKIVYRDVDAIFQGKRITSMTRLAVKAAVQIFDESNIFPDAARVMDRLRAWAIDGSEADCLIGVLEKENGVSWRTKNSEVKKYFMESLVKTLSRYEQIIRY